MKYQIGFQGRRVDEDPNRQINHYRPVIGFQHIQPHQDFKLKGERYIGFVRNRKSPGVMIRLGL